MSQQARTPDAWNRARDRFTEDLDEEEKRLYFEATPETLLYEISAKEKIHGENSKSRHLISSIQPFIDSVEHFGKVLDVFANTYPLVMSPLWGSFRIVIILAHDAGHYFDDVINMIIKVGNVLPRLHVYESLFPNHERLVQVLSLIYCDLLVFCNEAKKVLRKPKRSMLSITFNGFERKFKKLLLQFQDHEKSVEKEVRTSHMIESADSRTLVRLDQLEAAEERKKTERWQVFANLSEINYEGQHARFDDLRHEGTCEWITDEPLYKAWRVSTASSGLCCRGIPGSGKSVLMAKIVSDLRACLGPADDVTLFHFCDFAQPATLQIGQIYRAILKQVHAKNVMQEILIDKIVKEFKQNPHGIAEKQLQELVIQAIETCNSQRVNVVCDGLDECEQYDQRTICDMLSRLAGSDKACIKVLVTCREEERPLKYLKAFVHLHLTPDISHADMEVFVVGAIRSCIERGDMTLKNPALRQEVVNELVSKADGMFLWIHFQLLDLCEAASDARIRKILKDLPRGLDETYNRILYKASKSVNATNVRFALRWIACARRPLKVEELQEAAAFTSSSDTHGSPDQRWDAEKIPEADRLLQSCHGLVVRDRDGTVRFAHHTVRQFLLVKPSATDKIPQTGQAANSQHDQTSVMRADLFKFTKSQAETSIAELCATYLCFSDFETALTTTEKQQNMTINTIFKQGGPVAIPASLGIRRQMYNIPYRFLGGKSDFKVPDIDFVKQVRMKSARVSPSLDLRAKYALLDYVIEYWAWHTNQEIEPSESDRIDEGHRTVVNQLDVDTSLSMQSLLRIGSLKSFALFWRLVKERQLAFEIRPWGPNQHFGPYGCLGCPPPDVPQSEFNTNLNLDGTSALHWAAQSGHLPLIASFTGDLSTYMDHERYSQQTLVLACRYGHEEIVGLLLSHSHNPRRNDIALQEACQAGYLNVLQLLTAGESPAKSSRSWHSRTFGAEQRYLAHFAAEFGHVHILQYIFQYTGMWQVDPLKDASGRTMFHYAAMNGHYKIIDELVRNGVDCYDERCWDQQMTPMMLAAQNGHAGAVRALLAAGADPKVRGRSSLPFPFHEFLAPLFQSYGLTHGMKEAPVQAPMAVHLAARYGHAEVLQVLPIQNAESCSMNPIEGQRFDLSALHWATVYGHCRAMEALLKKGYDPNETISWVGLTAMQYAAAMDHGEAIDVLLKYGADPHLIIESGETPLHIISIYNKQDALSALIKAKISVVDPFDDFDHFDRRVEQRSSKWAGMSALQIALFKGHNEIAQTLLSEGVSPVEKVRPTKRLNDSPEMAFLKVLRIPLCMASASNLVDMETFKQLYEATTNGSGKPNDIEVDALCCAILGQQPQKLEALLDLGAQDRPLCREGNHDRVGQYDKLPLAMKAAIDDEQEIMVRILLRRKDMYPQRENLMRLARKYAVKHLCEVEELDARTRRTRGLPSEYHEKAKIIKRIISLLE